MACYVNGIQICVGVAWDNKNIQIFTCDKLKFVTLKIRVQTPYFTNFEAAIWSSKIDQICFNILTPLFSLC
jgi:hypothetical protein